MPALSAADLAMMAGAVAAAAFDKTATIQDRSLANNAQGQAITKTNIATGVACSLHTINPRARTKLQGAGVTTTANFLIRFPAGTVVHYNGLIVIGSRTFEVAWMPDESIATVVVVFATEVI